MFSFGDFASDQEFDNLLFDQILAFDVSNKLELIRNYKEKVCNTPKNKSVGQYCVADNSCSPQLNQPPPLLVWVFKHDDFSYKSY